MDRKFKKAFPLHSNEPKNRGNWLATLLAILLQQRHVRGALRPAAKRSRERVTLYTPLAGRKYLNAVERRRFAKTAAIQPVAEVRLFCLLLMWSGCRVSEGLSVNSLSFDLDASTVSIFTLKRRTNPVIREVPLPRPLVSDLNRAFGLRSRQCNADVAARRLWTWHRSTAWRKVKEVMRRAEVTGAAAMPKGLRHAFGVAAFGAAPPHIVQRWLGHASLRTTAIYGDVIGPEELEFARRLWLRW